MVNHPEGNTLRIFITEKEVIQVIDMLDHPSYQ